jgi:hypothetical protein
MYEKVKTDMKARFLRNVPMLRIIFHTTAEVSGAASGLSISKEKALQRRGNK